MTNLALTEPARFKLGSSNYIIKKTSPADPARFFLVGTVMLSDLWADSGAKQICIQPCDVTWPRAAAVLCEMQGPLTGKTRTFGMGGYKYVGLIFAVVDELTYLNEGTGSASALSWHGTLRPNHQVL